MNRKQLRRRYRLIAVANGLLALVFFTLATISAQDGAMNLTRLLLGDQRVSTEPQRGYIWSCQTQFNGGGAFQDGPWINGDGTWNRLAKVTVDGAVEWANVQFTIETVDGERVLSGNGLPPHITGVYPVQTSDDAYQYDRNPNSISEQTLTFSLPLNPTLADQTGCAGGIVGVMLTGIPLFNGFDAEGRDAAAHEVQDDCGGHPERTGQYHYHDLSPCIEKWEAGDAHSELVGYAFDGFGIYGFHGEAGVLLTNDDLDECHGHTHEIEWDGALVEMYHYHATAEFPYTIGCFRGTSVWLHPGDKGMGQPGGQGGQTGNQPPGGQGGQTGNQPPGGQGGQNPPPPPGGQGGQGGQNPPPPPGGGGQGGQQPPPPPGG